MCITKNVLLMCVCPGDLRLAFNTELYGVDAWFVLAEL